MSARPTALIADDEPLLRDALRSQLAIVWPELEIAAVARNGREAVKLFDERHPDICFLDVHMPGLSGVDAANHIGRRAHLVFVTAYDHYAVQAFAQGALDYLLKPVEQARLAETVSRLKERLQSSRPAINTEQLLQQLSEQLAKLQRDGGKSEALRWIRAQAGKTVRLIAIDDVDYLRSDAKYTIGRLARWRQTGRGGGADAVEGAARAARYRAIRASPSVGGREPARDQPYHPARQRNGGDSRQGPSRRSAGKPQLPAPVPADVAAFAEAPALKAASRRAVTAFRRVESALRRKAGCSNARLPPSSVL